MIIKDKTKLEQKCSPVSVKEGEEIEVKVLGIDRGRIKLSRKVLIEK